MENENLQAEQRNPLLERVRMPGETYTLPSKGLLYKNGELSPDVNGGEIYIQPMTAMEEIIIRSPDKLFSGAGITEIFKKCIPQVQKPLDLFAKDIDFLIVCLRKVSYGSEFEVEYQHNCKNAKKHSYMIQVDEFIQATKGIDPTTVGTAFSVKLDNSQKVDVMPIRYRDVVSTLQALNDVETTGKMPSVEEVQRRSLDTLLGVIDNVDGINDKKMIEEWLRELKAGMCKKISDKIEEINDWGPIFKKKVRCKDCGDEIDIAAPLNPMSFFI